MALRVAFLCASDFMTPRPALSSKIISGERISLAPILYVSDAQVASCSPHTSARVCKFPLTHLIRRRCADGLMPPTCARALVGSRDNFRASTTLNFHGAAYTVRHTKKGWIQERQE